MESATSPHLHDVSQLSLDVLAHVGAVEGNSTPQTGCGAAAQQREQTGLATTAGTHEGQHLGAAGQIDAGG